MAIKVVDKRRIRKLGKERHIMREKNILERLCHIHIVKLLNTFMIEQNIYFVF
ncbi:MAG: hypothetical protein ACK55Z_21865, partial [bacterium]